MKLTDEQAQRLNEIAQGQQAQAHSLAENLAFVAGVLLAGAAVDVAAVEVPDQPARKPATKKRGAR